MGSPTVRWVGEDLWWEGFVEQVSFMSGMEEVDKLRLVRVDSGSTSQTEGTHRVRTHAVLLLTLTLTQITSLHHYPNTIPLVGYPKIIPYTKFEHFEILRFFQLCSRQTNRRTQTSYPRRPTELAWADSLNNKR